MNWLFMVSTWIHGSPRRVWAKMHTVSCANNKQQLVHREKRLPHTKINANSICRWAFHPVDLHLSILLNAAVKEKPCVSTHLFCFVFVTGIQKKQSYYEIDDRVFEKWCNVFWMGLSSPGLMKLTKPIKDQVLFKSKHEISNIDVARDSHDSTVKNIRE